MKVGHESDEILGVGVERKVGLSTLGIEALIKSSAILSMLSDNEAFVWQGEGLGRRLSGGGDAEAQTFVKSDACTEVVSVIGANDQSKTAELFYRTWFYVFPMRAQRPDH